MDPDFPVPSIEHSNPPELKARHVLPSTSRRITIDAATSTPLPPSSPVKSPRKTPRPQRETGAYQASSPHSSVPPSPSNHDRRSSTPILHNKRSAMTLSSSRGDTPSRKPISRRTSSLLNPSLPSVSSKQPISEIEPQPPTPTAASILREYFAREISQHESLKAKCRMIVIVHDSCYGHRFSRPRTSKAALTTIVERPERIHATILGASAAYVRLGQRHTGGANPPVQDQTSDTMPEPPFKIRKTSRWVPLNHPAVTQVHGVKWMEELQLMCDSAEGKLALNGRELVRPIGYGKDESGSALPKLHEGDLYLCAESLNALQGCLGGVCDAVDTVFQDTTTRRAFVCIRPPGYHCSSNYPSGFCWLNNVHVGIAHAAISHGLTHAAIIDFDLHHGDGSQAITWDHNRKAAHLPKNAPAHKKTPIGYFSLHDINSYPCEMGDEEKVRSASMCIENAHGQSIWNVHLEPWLDHADFWKLYETRYSILLQKTRAFLQHHAEKLNSVPNGPRAKAAIFLSAGFDASEWEGAGMQRHKVNVPTDFYARFTEDVVKIAEEEGLGVNGRVVSVLEGGYSDRALTSGVLSHVCGLAHDDSIAPEHDSAENGLAYDISSRFGSLGVKSDSKLPKGTGKSLYSPDWWSSVNLEQLEALTNPIAQGAPSKPSDTLPGNYKSPTQASTAKVSEQVRVRRSISAQLELRLSVEPEPVQLSKVDWATAAYELSRLIIPNNRQTISCRHDELNAEATRARRERQSTVGLPTGGDEPMRLRDRKAKAALEDRSARPAPRDTKRRTTIAAVADLPDPELSPSNGQMMYPSGRPRRRSSGASSVMSGLGNMQLIEGDNKDPSSFDTGGTASRATSVMPEKPLKAPLVKKTRAPANPRPQSKAKTSPKKANASKPPLPRVPSAFMVKGPTEGAKEIVDNEKQSFQVRSGLDNLDASEHDLDTLATGMKKMSIKLTVPSPEENAERERKAREERQKKTRAPRKPAVPKTTKTILSERPTLPEISPAIPPGGNSTKSKDLSSAVFAGGIVETQPRFETVSEQPQNRLDETEPLLSKAVDMTEIDTTEVDTAEAPVDKRLPFAPIATTVAPETVHSHPQVAGLETVLISNTPGSVSAPATARKSKADLPVFTSTSPIPFAKPPQMSTIVAEVKQDQEAPAIAAESNDGKENLKIPLVDGAVKEEISNEGSIWDVPKTPQR